MKHYFFPVLITFLASGLFWVTACAYIDHTNKPKCKHHYINAIEDGRFIIVPTDSADGKPTFTVIFEDDSTMDHMFAEEVLVGLSKGEWRYNDFLGESGHTCYDSTHLTCDGECECDGIMCTKRGN